MDIKIRLSLEEVKEIVKTHVLKEIPVHTAGKEVDVSGHSYSDWEVDIREVKND
ncbi:MAG: hypothetical protein U9R43_08815 [Thermodesulfobacteriota bacterium]|nr:hypothetical protein [Thermodesulfobacteriota bacterium]